MKEYMYNWDQATRPSIVGKYDEEGIWVLPSIQELTPARIARLIAKRLGRFFTSEHIRERLDFLTAKEKELALPRANFPRAAHFCSGCPHNTSTKVPDGSRAGGGIGCHYMVTWMDRKTDTFTQMGGEGTPWIGQSPFTDEKHIFQNLGDGTYFHSGSLAMRACVAAKVNITFKILYNDAVAMTGGQPVDGSLTVQEMARQVSAEGVKKIVLVSDDPDKWRNAEGFPSGVKLEHRDDLDKVQRELREVTGTSVIIYEQTCAAEKRRRRKRKLAVDPPKRILINPAVCEGCGDCGEVSNCVSLLPLETEMGRKRTIDQSSCNKDFSCVKGFCPSFVTVLDGSPRKPKGSSADPGFSKLPMPVIKSNLAEPWNILITGVGGTGVVTIGALIGMAAHLEGKGTSVLDQTGLAQKGGAVTCHVRIATKPEDINAVRIAAGEADLVIGCDVVVVNDYWALSKIREDRTHAVINSYEFMPGTFTRKPDMQFPLQQMLDSIGLALGHKHLDVLNATEVATALIGDSIATNSFVMGYAWQKGLIPLSLESLMRAIELNDAAIAMNKLAFNWGRMAVENMHLVLKAAGMVEDNIRPLNSSAFDSATALMFAKAPVTKTLDDLIAHREKLLTEYQDSAYAQRYRQLVDLVRKTEAERTPGKTDLSAAVARYFAKVMAYKDEYEVARLYTSGDFEKLVKDSFQGDDIRLKFNLAPPIISKKDPVTGHLLKQEFPGWTLKAFKQLAKLKGLRGGALDVFGKTDERKMERQLIVDYKNCIEGLLSRLNPENHALAVEIAKIPEHIRGYGHVKEAHYAKAKTQWDALMTEWQKPTHARSVA